MASENKIKQMLALISTLYPYYTKEMNKDEKGILINAWKFALKNYTDEEVETAFEQALSTCQYAPVPADIVAHIKKARKSLSPSDEELWIAYETALRNTCDQVSRFPFTIRESNGLTQGQNARNRVDKIFEELPPKVKAYVGSKGELIRLSQDWEEDRDFARYEKPKFLKAMPSIEEQIEYKNNLLLSTQAHNGELNSYEG